MADKIDNLETLYAFNAEEGTVEPQSLTAVENLVVDGLKEVFGEDSLETNPSTPMGRLIEWLSVNFHSCLALNIQNSYQLFVQFAAGQQLDSIAMWFGLERKAGYASSVEVELTGTPGAKIPSGIRASTDSGNVFTMVEEAVIGADGTGVGKFESMEEGQVLCGKGELKSIETATAGLSYIYNTKAATLGRAMETDEELRERILASRYSGIGFLDSMYAALNNVEGVDAVVVENNTGARLGVRGIDMDPHSICVCADISNPDNKEKIAQVIFKNKPCGTGYTKLDGCVEVPVKDSFGTEYKVYINPVSGIDVYVSVKVKRRGYSGYNLEEDVRNAILTWASGDKKFKVGESLYSADLTKAVEDKVQGIIVVSCTVNDGGRDAGKDSDEMLSYLDIAPNRRVTFNRNHIRVVEQS